MDDDRAEVLAEIAADFRRELAGASPEDQARAVALGCELFDRMDQHAMALFAHFAELLREKAALGGKTRPGLLLAARTLQIFVDDELRRAR